MGLLIRFSNLIHLREKNNSGFRPAKLFLDFYWRGGLCNKASLHPFMGARGGTRSDACHHCGNRVGCKERISTKMDGCPALSAFVQSGNAEPVHPFIHSL
jgi:hypothetical protein